MKRLTIALIYGLITALGLIWAIGCSTSSSGPTSGSPQYQLQLSVSHYSLHNGDADTVYCWVQNLQNTQVIFGAKLRFSTRSLNPSQSNITTAATSDTLSTGTGTFPVVHYNPINIADTSDVIYAALLTDDQLDTLLVDSVTVTILH
jgi:hypothetical protein